LEKRDYKLRWLVIAVVITAVILVVMIFKVDIFKYTCESEQNSASCYLLAEHYESIGESELADKYHNMACNFQYEQSCSKLRVKLKPAPTEK
jgi:cytochrome c-type biogenesis protein CcmH/NrfG